MKRKSRKEEDAELRAHLLAWFHAREEWRARMKEYGWPNEKGWAQRHAVDVIKKTIPYGALVPSRVVTEAARREGVSRKALSEARWLLRIKSINAAGRWHWVREGDPDQRKLRALETEQKLIGQEVEDFLKNPRTSGKRLAPRRRRSEGTR